MRSMDWQTGDLLRDQIRADELQELGWPIVEERDIGRGMKEGVAMEDRLIQELGGRLTDARNQIDIGFSLLVLQKFDRAQLRSRAENAKSQIEHCLKLLREQGFTIDIGG